MPNYQRLRWQMGDDLMVGAAGCSLVMPFPVVGAVISECREWWVVFWPVSCGVAGGGAG
jgi:hypothetical protein